MTVEPATRKQYESTARRFARWLEARGSDLQEPDQWVDALQALTVGRSRATWRLYRHAITWHLRETQGGVISGRFSLASEGVERPPTKKRPVLRHIEPEVLDAIVRSLISRRSERARRLADILISMVVTGLRPSEFSTARLTDGVVRTLIVNNAKYAADTAEKPGRGNGPSRELVIDERASPQIVGAIIRALDWCHGRDWSSLAPNANALFRATIKKLVSRREIGSKWQRLRIYDCRHQFSANAKEHLDLLAGEVAAAMGHRSVVTAVSHYGRRRFARSGAAMVRPSEKSVADVSEKSKMRALALIQRSELKRSIAAEDPRANQVEPTKPADEPLPTKSSDTNRRSEP